MRGTKLFTVSGSHRTLWIKDQLEKTLLGDAFPKLRFLKTEIYRFSGTNSTAFIPNFSTFYRYLSHSTSLVSGVDDVNRTSTECLISHSPAIDVLLTQQ